MNFLKKLTGVFVFVLAIAGAFAVSRYFSGPRPAVAVETPPPVTPAIPPDPRLIPYGSTAKPPQFDAAKPSPPELIAPAQVFFKARQVTLNFTSKKSFVTLELERDRAHPAPSRVWAWVTFFSSEDGGRCAGEPVEVRQPFARGERATVVVEADASACGRPRSPAATVYARVNVSAASAESARLEDSHLFDDLSKATPVVLAGANKN